MPILTIPPSPGGPPTFSFKASRQPLLWAALAHASGIVAGVYLWRPVLWWFGAGAAFAASAAYFARRRSALGWALALGTFFLAGALHIQVRGGLVRLDTGIQAFADREELQITAHVTRDGRWQSGSFNEMKQTLDVESEKVETSTGQVKEIHSGIRLNVYGSPSEDKAHSPQQASTPPLFHYGEHPIRRKAPAAAQFPQSRSLRLSRVSRR